MSKIVASNEKKTVTLQDVQDAAIRIGPFINHTPVMTCSTLDKLAGKSLFFKCENFQKAGAFKFRGAMNAIVRLTESNPQDNLPEVVTYTSGNHGQGVALAAKIKGLKAHVVMPHYAPDIKKSAIRDYGARIIDTYGISQENLVEEARNVLEQTGPNSHLVSPREDEDVIAGQGTMALELLEQVPDIDAIIAPVGSGGMVSGISIPAKKIKPGIKIFAAEPLEADDCAKSFAAGERITLSGPVKTVADGLAGSLGFTTWPIIRDNIEDVITVTENEIISAMRLVWERMKLVIEPSGAVGLAAVLSEKFRDERTKDLTKVGIILCGGNVDLDADLPWNKNK